VASCDLVSELVCQQNVREAVEIMINILFIASHYSNSLLFTVYHSSAHLTFSCLIMHTLPCLIMVVVWRSGGALVSINEVNLRRARLVLEWVIVSGLNSQCGTFISICNQPPRPTQPGHPFVGRRNSYQPKGGDALRLGTTCVSDK